jgi:hypothetical protein
MPILSLSVPTNVAFPTANPWSNLSDIFSPVGPSATAQVKTDWVRVRVDVPSPPFISLPPYISLQIQVGAIPNPTSPFPNAAWSNWAVVSLGDVSGPLGTNAALGATPARLPSGLTLYSFDCLTDGVTIAALNAGDVYFWFRLEAEVEVPPVLYPVAPTVTADGLTAMYNVGGELPLADGIRSVKVLKGFCVQ